MNINEAKILGGIGAILSLVGLIPIFGGASFGLYLIGLILIIVAVKVIADHFKDDSIFKNYLISLICAVISIVVLVAVVTAGALTSIDDFSALQQDLEGMDPAVMDPTMVVEEFGGLIGSCLLGLVAMWIFNILGSVFLRKSYNSIAEKTGVDMFRTTGTLYLVGWATVIILIGFVILLIAKIMEMIAYFSLDESKMAMTTPMGGSGMVAGSPPPAGDTFSAPAAKPNRHCPNCGRQIEWDATECPFCGKRSE